MPNIIYDGYPPNGIVFSYNGYFVPFEKKKFIHITKEGKWCYDVSFDMNIYNSLPMDQWIDKSVKKGFVDNMGIGRACQIILSTS